MTRRSTVRIGLIIHNNHGTRASATAKQQRDRRLAGVEDGRSGNQTHRMNDSILLLWTMDTW